MATSKTYFDSSADSPIELGKINIDFYKDLIKEFGSSAMNKNLWPGETLLALINDMKMQYATLKSKAQRKEAAKLIKQFKSLYKTLINE